VSVSCPVGKIAEKAACKSVFLLLQTSFLAILPTGQPFNDPRKRHILLSQIRKSSDGIQSKKKVTLVKKC